MAAETVEAVEAVEAVVNMAPYVGIITHLIGWTGVIILLSIFYKAITHALAIAITEFLLKYSCQDKREWLLRWFGNREELLQVLKELDEKLAEDSKPTGK